MHKLATPHGPLIIIASTEYQSYKWTGLEMSTWIVLAAFPPIFQTKYLQYSRFARSQQAMSAIYCEYLLKIIPYPRETTHSRFM